MQQENEIAVVRMAQEFLRRERSSQQNLMQPPAAADAGDSSARALQSMQRPSSSLLSPRPTSSSVLSRSRQNLAAASGAGGAFGEREAAVNGMNGVNGGGGGGGGRAHMALGGRSHSYSSPHRPLAMGLAREQQQQQNEEQSEQLRDRFMQLDQILESLRSPRASASEQTSARVREPDYVDLKLNEFREKAREVLRSDFDYRGMDIFKSVHNSLIEFSIDW